MTSRVPVPGTPTIDPALLGEMRQASRATNIDFSYLVAEAAQESDFNPQAKASTSSATGLYQFLDTTWMQAVKQFGGKYGLGNLADQISIGSHGQAHAADPAVEQQILDLRKDPKVSTEIAAEFARQNKETVEKGLGRAASTTDLYLAHFLGATGATQFVKKIESDGNTKAADLMPQAAAANPAVFYDSKTGIAKTVAQVYTSFAAKIEQQISRFAAVTGGTSGMATGTESETAAEASAQGLSGMPLAKPTKTSTPLLAMLNILTLAAMKMLNQPSRNPDNSDSADNQAPNNNKHRSADTKA